MKTFFYLLLFSLILNACKKHDHDDHEHEHLTTTDTSYPVITLSSPIENSAYTNADTVFINGVVTDNELHDGYIEIKDDTTGQIYFTSSPYVHGLTSAPINFSHIVNVIKNSKVTLKVSYQDHKPNVSQKLVHMTFNL